MANLAKFTIEGTASSPGGYDATTAQVLDFALEGGPASLVNRWTLQVYDPTDLASPLASYGAPLLSLVGATTGQKVDAATPAATITCTVPSGMNSWIVRSLVNGGNDAKGNPHPDYVFERMVVVRDGSSRRKIMASEATQYGPEGWARAVNEMLAVAAPSLSSGTEVGQDLKWNGSIFVPGRSAVRPALDLTGSTDMTSAINAAANSRPGAWVDLPDGVIRVDGQLTLPNNGVSLTGHGGDFGDTATILLKTSTTGDFIVSTSQNVGIRNLMIQQSNASAAPTSGYAIALTDSFMPIIENVRLQNVYDGVKLDNAIGARLDGTLWLRSLFGTKGLWIDGESGVAENIAADNPYPLTSNRDRAWEASHVYSLGQTYYTPGGLIFQVTVAGTSHATTPPAAVPGTNVGNARTTNVTDGTATVRFIGRLINWVEYVSGGGWTVKHAALLNGARGILHNGSGANWLFVQHAEIDHPYLCGVELVAGSGFYTSGLWVSSCFTGHGVFMRQTFVGEALFGGGRIFGNGQNGMKIENTSGVALARNLNIHDMHIGCNSANNAGNDHGIAIDDYCTDFNIHHNRIGNIHPSIGNGQAYGIVAAGSNNNHYNVSHNGLRGNVNPILVSSGTGATKVVGNNY